jgi:hypothetical protein
MATYNFVSTAYGWTLAKDGGIAKPYFVKPDRIEPVGGDTAAKQFSLIWDNGRTETYNASADTIQIGGVSVSGNTLAAIIDQLGTDIFFLTNGGGGVDETAVRTYANEEITEWAAASPTFTSMVKIQYASPIMRFIPTTNFQEMKIMFTLSDGTSEMAGIKFNLNTGLFDIGGFGGAGLRPRFLVSNVVVGEFTTDRTLKIYKDGINLHFRPATGASNYIGMEWRDSTDAVLGRLAQQVATGDVFFGSHSGDATPEIKFTYASRKVQIGYDLDVLGAAKVVGNIAGFELMKKFYTTYGSNIKGHTVGGHIAFNSWTSLGLTDGQIVWGVMYLEEGATLTGVKFWQQVAGDYTADNNNRIGIYTLSAGTLTQRAVTANNGNLWKSAQGLVQEAFSATYAASAGFLFFAYIYSNSAQTTQPTIGAITAGSPSGATGFDMANSVKSFGSTNGADLPATQAMSGITGISSRPFMSVY